MGNDWVIVFYWWFEILIIGLIFLPFTRKIFRNFWDNGYLFSKIIGISFSSYFVWFLASFKILPFQLGTIWLSLALYFLAGVYVFLLKPIKRKDENKRIFKIFIFEEFLFLLALFFWSWIRGFQPNIEGLEKFMDFGFVNSILRSKYFPPADMWFAGKSINYYYFGHYITAFLTKLSGLDPAITYNLMMATLFAFCFSLTFSLTANLIYFWKKFEQKENYLKELIFGGIFSALIISLGANLHPAYYNFKMKILKKPYCNGSFFYWYPDATRYIGYCPDVDDKTIHEFPSYSFVVSDLHGHVLDIPIVLTYLGLMLVFLIKNDDLIPKQKTKKIKINIYLNWLKIAEEKIHFYKNKFNDLFFLLLPGFFLAIAFMTNQWDYPIYLLLSGGVLLLKYSVVNKGTVKTNIKEVVTKTFLGCLTLVITSVFLVMPFLLNFKQIAQGIALVHAKTRFYQLLILWGGFWFYCLSFILFAIRPKIKLKSIFKRENFVKFWAKILGVKISINKKGSEKALNNKKGLILTDWFILVIIAVGFVLIIIPEIIYVKDIYISSHHRANTMFKLTYQSFIMYCVILGYVIFRVTSGIKNIIWKRILGLIYTLIWSACMIYPFYSIKGYYGTLRPENYKGLWGLSFLESLYPDDFKAVQWFNKNVKDQVNILEAVGDSYTHYERISMATGLPTIQGWLVHEWLWRGSFDEPGKRAGEVQVIYETENADQAKELLEKYKVKYVVIGEMERKKYPLLKAEKFEKIGNKVFQSGYTAIYQID